MRPEEKDKPAVTKHLRGLTLRVESADLCVALADLGLFQPKKKGSKRRSGLSGRITPKKTNNVTGRRGKNQSNNQWGKNVL